MAAKKSTKQLTMIDLFAGCGGLSLGLEEAGFHPLLFSELNKSAADTYMANRPGKGIKYVGDVYSLTNDDLAAYMGEWTQAGIPDIDLVCGGPPCQGYSGIGHRRSFSVTKEQIPSNHLYKEMIRVIEQVRPKLFLFENVKGLLSGRWTPSGEKGEIWEDVKASFRAIEGYTIRHTIVHAKNYGVPQNRPRVLLVGIRDDIRWAGTTLETEDAVEAGLLPKGKGGYPDIRDVFSDLVDSRYRDRGQTDKYLSSPKSDFQKEIRRIGRNVLQKGDPLTEQEYSDHAPRIREKFQYMIDHGGKVPPRMQTKKFAQRVIPETWGEDGPSITATSLPDDFVHYAQPRSLTVREWARLQTFPDWYQFKGPRTTGGHRRAGNPDEGNWDREVPKYTQIGNAVPVRLAKAVGSHFKALLANNGPRNGVRT